MRNIPVPTHGVLSDDLSCLQTIYFWEWIGGAILESVVLSVLPLFTLWNGDYRTGTEDHFLQAGMTCLTAIIIIANIKVSLQLCVYFEVTVSKKMWMEWYRCFSSSQSGILSLFWWSLPPFWSMSPPSSLSIVSALWITTSTRLVRSTHFFSLCVR